MGRMRRIEYEGAVYHVIQRGNNKEYIFNEDIDKGYLIKQFKESHICMGFRIFGYVLMDNHYHFLIQTFDKPLQTVMHQINNKYSKFYNYKYNHSGHVFQGRYKAILVMDERYLLAVLRYMHQNPIRAKMCNHVKEYKWSSDVFYRSNIKGFIDIDSVLDIISKNRVQAIKKYRNFINKIDSADYENITIIGEEPVELYKRPKELEEGRKPLDEILIETNISDDDYKLIKSGSRKRHLTQYKIAYVKKAIELKYTLKEIGSNIKTSETAILNLLSRKGSTLPSPIS